MNANGLVSIIMPAYNAGKTISQSIESVINQSYPDLELIITDDNSLDNTLEIARSYAQKDPRVKILKNKLDKGVSNARNNSIQQAKGEYISFLDSDDSWDWHKLEKQITAMNESGLLASHASYYRCNEQGEIIGKVACKDIVNFSNMLNYNHIGNLTGIYNANKLGKFYQKEIGHQDYEMWLRILKKTSSIGIKDYSAFYTVSETSISANKFKAAYWHYNILASHFSKRSYHKKFYFFGNYITYNLKKRIQRKI